MHKDVLEMFNRISKTDLEECFLKINKYIENVEAESCDRLRRLQEYNKDDEIAKLNKEIEFLRTNSVYVMSDTEKLSYRKFVEEHNKECKRSNFEIRITGTGIGHIINCVCLTCNKSLDITDMSKW